MNILHFILGKANPNRANGVNQVIYGLAKYQSLAGHHVYVVGISKNMEKSYEKIDRGFFEVEAYKSFNGICMDRLKEIINEVDIVHLHGVWNFKNIRLGRYLRSIGKPYVITAHCGYSMDRIKQSNYWLKLIYHHCLQKRLFEGAIGIHAITREESTDISHFCPNGNIFVVSNGVDSDKYGQYEYHLHNRSKIRLGYLGRLAIEKNLDNLIRAIAMLPETERKQVELYLIGPKNTDYSKLLILVRQLGLDDTVVFTDGKFGDEKIQSLLDLDIYIHPAYSDVVGISVMEAFALGLPTIVTRTSHMSYFYSSNAFVMVEPTSFDICRGIRTMIANKVTWMDLSRKAKLLFEDNFNWKLNADKMIASYKYIIK
jgi:glycosyltransferase involved in cell wall biosynthesis